MIKYLCKFVSQYEHAEFLLDGKLFMRPAEYYHYLPNGQGDIREAKIFEDVMIHKNTRFPIYCMYMISDTSIENGVHIISKQCINDFRCEHGYVVVIPYDAMCERLYEVNTCGYCLDAGPVTYKTLSLEESGNLFIDNDYKNLFIKHPYFYYQKEYRIVIGKEVYKLGNNPIDNVEYCFKRNFRDVGQVIDISSLNQSQNGYELDLS